MPTAGEPQTRPTSAHDSQSRLSACEAFDLFDTELHRFIVVRLGGNRDQADDIMQRLWIKARAHRQSMESDHAERWLRRVAVNLINETWRQSRLEPANLVRARPDIAKWLAERIDRELLPIEQIEREEVREQLLLAITELPADDQRLLIGRYVDERSLRELAQFHGMTERAVEGRLYRARQRLKEILETSNTDERCDDDERSN